jgi:hypothetical protein
MTTLPPSPDLMILAQMKSSTFMERETRLELATSTLARLRSTN